MINLIKYVLIFFISFSVSSCQNGHRRFIVSVDPATGIKKEIETIDFGTGGGFTGQAPRLTKQTITKYNRKNQIIYFSRKEIHRQGCSYSTPIWKISTIDPMGLRKEFSVNDTMAIIQILDRNNNVLEEKRQKRSEFIQPDWFDVDEHTH